MPGAMPSRVNWKSGGNETLHLYLPQTYSIPLSLPFLSLPSCSHSSRSCRLFNTISRLFVPICVPYYQAATIGFNSNVADLSRNVSTTTTSPAHHNPNPLSLAAFCTLSEASSALYRSPYILPPRSIVLQLASGWRFGSLSGSLDIATCL